MMSISKKGEQTEGNELHRACLAGDVDLFERILKDLGNSTTPLSGHLSEEDVHGNSPLVIAVRNGHLQIAKRLLDLDVDTEIGSRNRDGITPLFVACNRGNLAMAKLLLSRGANMEARCDTGATSLFIATLQGHTHIVAELLRHGADVNAARVDGSTSLHAACAKGFKGIAELLLSHGANVEAKGSSGATPLHEACGRNQLDLVQLLIDHRADLEAQTSSGHTPIFSAFARHNLQIEKLLLAHGARVGTTDPMALVRACEKNEYTYASWLIMHGANVDMEDCHGWQPLTYATMYQNYKLMKELLDKGADVNGGRDKPLVFAARKNDIRAIQMLIKQGADLNVGLFGATPLFYMLKELNFEMAKAMLLAGAKDPGRENEYTRTTLHVVCQSMINPELQCEVAELLLKNGADVNAVFATHRTPQVFVKPQVRIFKTALHFAMHAKFEQMVRLLVNAGANYSHLVILEDDKEIHSTVWQLCEGKAEFRKIFDWHWNTTNHLRHPACVRDAIKCFLLVNKVLQLGLDNTLLYKIFEYVADQWQLV